MRDYVFIDFCAGGGGPTPSIEKHLNKTIGSTTDACAPEPSNVETSVVTNHQTQPANSQPPPQPESYADALVNGTEEGAEQREREPVRFVLTDLHPHVSDWEKAAAESPNLSFIRESVDAANAPPNDQLLGDYHRTSDKKVFRLFNLAFHHFDDPLAKAILRNTIETSDGFGIFELQDRSFLNGFLTCVLFGLGIFALAPYYAIFVWQSPLTLFFTYAIPILPFVLVFDGWMSALRTRTPEEVEALLRTCGAQGYTPEEIEKKWEVTSGKERFMWPVGTLNWVVAVKR